MKNRLILLLLPACLLASCAGLSLRFGVHPATQQPYFEGRYTPPVPGKNPAPAAR